MQLATGNTTLLQHQEKETVSLFEEAYLRLRKKENRIYSDEVVALLPLVPPGHPHASEWKLRAQSSKRLIEYLGNKNKLKINSRNGATTQRGAVAQLRETFLDILEVGCGNGWLSHRLSMLPMNVTGCDINQQELQQAVRVFSSFGIRFTETDSVFSVKNKFDVIVFAASMQYFRSLKDTIEKFSTLLNESGEIHILDTHFYNKINIESARQRTVEYFHRMNADEMTDHYFHHSIEEVKAFKHKFLYNSSFSFLKNKKNPFPWICIYK